MSIIYTDNLCDLSKEELKKYKVEQISFPLTFFAKTYKSFDDFDNEKFNDAIKNNSDINISPITKQEYIDAFELALNAGQDVIYIHASAKLFSTTSTLNDSISELTQKYPNLPHPGSVSQRWNFQCLKMVYNGITLKFSFFLL